LSLAYRKNYLSERAFFIKKKRAAATITSIKRIGQNETKELSDCAPGKGIGTLFCMEVGTTSWLGLVEAFTFPEISGWTKVGIG